jgi:hypothetical protein
MALTDAERLQAVALALMRQSVITTSGGEVQQEYLSITYKSLYSVTFTDQIIGTPT